jgi:hypothetical protein
VSGRRPGRPGPLGRHGVVGANVYLFLLVAGAVPVLAGTLRSSGMAHAVAAATLLTAAAIAAIVSIRRLGGGGVGEPLGCLGGLSTWALAWVGGTIAAGLGAGPTGIGWMQVLGAALPSLLLLAFSLGRSSTTWRA